MPDLSPGMLLVEASAEAFRTGPSCGERLPDFTLPNHRGKAINFAKARDGRRALVHFFRSVSW